MKRVNFYIDGFNLYFGIVNAGYNHCKWLDIERFANTLKNSSQRIHEIKYFTSRINNNPEKQKRQNTYLDALATTSVIIIYGEFRTNWTKCKFCGQGRYESKEKKTDVNIAVNLLIDAYEDHFDEAIIVSGDSDLVPPIKAVRRLFPQKEIRIALPPTHESNDLMKNSNGGFKIGLKKLEIAQFPPAITTKYGIRLECPKEWC